jgi:hypothetical protein
MLCPYDRLSALGYQIGAIGQGKHNFQLDIRDSLAAQQKVSVGISTIAVSPDNRPLQIRQQTDNCPRLEALFVGHNGFISISKGSHSQRGHLVGRGAGF